MWNNVSFISCPDAFFEYKFDGDMFMINCELYSAHLTGGKVRVHADGAVCELGSLKYDRGLLLLERTYPISFLRSNGIETEKITHFSIEASDGEIIASYPLGTLGNTLDDAQKLLDKMKAPSVGEDSKIIAQEIRQKIKKLKKETLPFMPDFVWHRVDDIHETFSLSAIRHIVSDSSFVHCFKESGFWLVGYMQGEDIFAVCIKGEDSLQNPMENALDCCVGFEAEGKTYYVVGIGLFDDGQYFVRV